MIFLTRVTLLTRAGDAFRDHAKKYLSLMLSKGVPSLFANLKHLYSDAYKRDILPVLAEEYIRELKAGEGNEQANGDSSKGEGAALYFLAQHYNYHLSRDLAKAEEYVEKAIALDPKNTDFHMTKARIYKHQGNTQKAAEAMDQARLLDTRDRYINSKTAKYQLRNDENEKALETMGLFTRADTVGGPFADLLEMQCIWYLTEDGESHARQGNVGLALKRFHAIYNIFDVWQEDQFDFHTFSLRKGQVRAYVDMIRWEDRLRDHPFYSRAALDAIKVYLDMHDRDQSGGGGANGVNGVSSAGTNGDDNAAVERKKAAKKAKKEAQRAEKEAAEKAAKQDPNKATAAKKDEPAKKVDEDPNGAKLAATADPLGEATKFLAPLLQFSPKNIEAQIAGFEVYIRRSTSPNSILAFILVSKKNCKLTRPTEKYLLALRCLNAALALDAQNPLLHAQGIELRCALNSCLGSLPPKVQETLEAEFTAVPASADLRKRNAEFLDKHRSDGAAHRIAAARAAKVLGEPGAAIDKSLVDALDVPDVTFEEAAKVLELLRRWRSGEAGAFKEKAHGKWPEVTQFA